jgi:hypothetical protein
MFDVHHIIFLFLARFAPDRRDAGNDFWRDWQATRERRETESCASDVPPFPASAFRYPMLKAFRSKFLAPHSPFKVPFSHFALFPLFFPSQLPLFLSSAFPAPCSPRLSPFFHLQPKAYPPISLSPPHINHPIPAYLAINAMVRLVSPWMMIHTHRLPVFL